MMPHDELKVDIISDQQQDSSASTQNNNGNDRSHASTGVGAQEKFIPITVLLEMVARMLGVLVCGWVVLVLVQGGMVVTVETKDRGFITVLFFLVCFRCWRYYCPQATGSLTEATQSLSADYSSIPNDIQQLALPIRFISRLFYCSKLVSAMTSVVLSVMRLASQDFGKTEVANKGSRDFALKVFYGLTLAEALMLLFALMFSFPIMANSVGPGNGPEDGPVDGPGDGPGDGSESGPGYGSGSGPGYGLGDGPANQSNDCKSAESANYSNRPADGPADPLSKLRQRPKGVSQESLDTLESILSGGTTKLSGGVTITKP